MPTRITDEEFVEAWKRLGSPQRVSDYLKLNVRKVYERRRSLEIKGHELPSFGSPLHTKEIHTIIPDNRRIITHNITDGMVFVASDAHYWPGEVTVAHRAFVQLLKEFKPQTVVMNGDVFDGARISRHEPLYGANPPTPKQEIETCVDRLNEIKNASKNAKTFWTFGNHDVRLHRYIAVNATELSDMVDLFDYFPGWHTCWRLDINDVIVKHRWHNGVHANYNNTLRSGRSIVTGHLHKLMATPFTDYNGRRWGIDSGTLADIYGDQFTYCEENPVSWASGFVVLTFRDGKLLTPEFCEVLDGVAYFRGETV